MTTSARARRLTAAEGRRWLVAIAVAALLAIVGAVWPIDALHYAAKPLATMLCIGFAVAGREGVSARYRRWIVAGMTCGLLGDVLLMLPGDWFVFGLGAFLLGHIAYLVAIVGEAGWQWARWPLLPLGVANGAFFWRFAVADGNTLGGLLAPVAAYATMISCTAYQAMAAIRTPWGLMAGIGMFWFVVSDLTLAAERFGDVLPSPADRIAILLTYWVAQTALARSVHGPREAAGTERA
jgi:uncharacterized membrane protein YhhN